MEVINKERLGRYNILQSFFMLTEIHLPFPDKIDKSETVSFYLSFLIRSLVIMGEDSYNTKITKEEFIQQCMAHGISKSSYLNTWNKGAKAGQFFKIAIKGEGEDYIVLNGKENVIGEKGFATLVGVGEHIGYYRFQAFITEMYAVRPVTQKNEFYEEFYRAKRKKGELRIELLKRLDETKEGRGQKRIANQSGCCHKTANNRLNKLADKEEISLLKRLSSYNGFKINLTNIYGKHGSTFIHFQTKKFCVCKDPIVNGKKVMLLNDCKKYLRGDYSVYEGFYISKYKG